MKDISIRVTIDVYKRLNNYKFKHRLKSINAVIKELSKKA